MKYEQEITKYNVACNEILHHFKVKYFCDRKTAVDDIDSFWIADRIGSVVCIGDYFWNMEDMVYALEKNISAKRVFDYNDKSIEDREDAPRSLYQYVHTK